MKTREEEEDNNDFSAVINKLELQSSLRHHVWSNTCSDYVQELLDLMTFDLTERARGSLNVSAVKRSSLIKAQWPDDVSHLWVLIKVSLGRQQKWREYRHSGLK